MTRIVLTAVLSVALGGFAAARTADGACDGCGEAASESRAAVTAIKSVVNHSRFRLVVRNTENPNKLGNGAIMGPLSGPQRVDMWIPWARTISEFRTHHISVVLLDGERPFRRWAIWQRADFDGDFVRVGMNVRPDDSTELPYAEPGTRIPIVSTVGGDRTLTISVNGDLVLSGFREP